jgi:RNA polymerase sigma-70 factor, ECF subfamily
MIGAANQTSAMEKKPFDGPASSADLILRAQRGDRSALSALLSRHMPMLQRWAHGRLPRWARAFGDTADLVQDAVLNTFRRFDQFDARGEKALQGYLRLAVQNRIVDLVRRSKARGTTDELTDEEPDRHQPSPLALAISAEEHQRYRAALARLKNEDQQLIVGRFDLGYSFEQLTLMAGKPSVDATRMALRRAVTRLVDEMSRE